MIQIRGEKNNNLLIGGLTILFSEHETILSAEVTKNKVVIVYLSAYTNDIDWHNDFEIAKRTYDERILLNPSYINAYSSKGDLIWKFNKRPILSFDIAKYKGKEVVKVRTNAPFHDILYLINPNTGEIILETPTR